MTSNRNYDWFESTVGTYITHKNNSFIKINNLNVKLTFRTASERYKLYTSTYLLMCQRGGCLVIRLLVWQPARACLDFSYPGLW